MNEQSPPVPPLNRSAIISLVAAILTALSFCTAVAPIPLTGYVCYPAAVVFGLVALVSGAAALLQIRTTREDGHWDASLFGKECTEAVLQPAIAPPRSALRLRERKGEREWMGVEPTAARNATRHRF